MERNIHAAPTRRTRRKRFGVDVGRKSPGKNGLARMTGVSVR